MGRNANVPKHIASGPGERIETTVLKRRKKIERVHADKVRKGLDQQRAAGKKRELRKQVFRNARDFINNFKRREANKKDLARRHRQQVRTPMVVPKTYEGSLAFVIRVKGDDIPEVSRRLLKMWRLHKMYEGVFLTVNEASLKQLHMLKDYVKWGYPTPEQVGVLLRTRGYTTNDSGMRIPLGGNMVIEKQLGAQGILCLEDMEHAISNHTEQFQAVVDFLAPFRLEPPEKDDAVVTRRKRERNTTAGDNTFASYLLTVMPELPSAKKTTGKKRAAPAEPVAEAPKEVEKEEPVEKKPAAKKRRTVKKL
eukprot:TRINITY_DN57810_c0_g1_i1.p1 TRINITY_DN57810_c0_g1~~TRINITY_DN57810_c0_g1_i1.p1  ORF type:complete len:309 (+),score=141.46 TRINITY_DN57810_c0_g1_i1:43-969(+)